MKTKTLFAIATMTLLLTSCEKFITQDVEITTFYELTESDSTLAVFTATTEEKAETRTTISDNTNDFGSYSLYWSKGDEISIFDGNNTSYYTTENDGESYGEFTHKEGSINLSAYVYTAFYPSKITKSNMILPANQSYVQNDVSDFPMVAISSTKDLEFKNMCGIIRLSINCEDTGFVDVSKISLSADNLGMSGEFSIGEDNAAIVVGTDGVVLTCEVSVCLYKSVATDFNIVVPKGDYNPLKVKITNSAGKEINFVSEDKINVSRSGITKISLTVSPSMFESSLETIPIIESDVEFTSR